MQRQMAPVPWEQHLPQVVFLHNGANARLLSSHGASFATVYVACCCPSCEKRPVAPFRTGGCVLGLGDWALHVGLKAASLAEVHVNQPGSDEKVPLAVWLQSTSLKMGGESLKRRQVNVFHWNGKLVPDSSDTGIKPVYRHLPCTQLPTAYEGLGSWRAATIRGYDPSTCRFEIKYHDEPKRSQAHIWLPLAVLHFARNPPATEAAVRSSPDTASQPSTSPFTTQSCDAVGDVTPQLQRLPTLPMPLAIQPQSWVYGQPMPRPMPTVPLPVQLAVMAVQAAPPPPLHDRVSPPLLGSFHSIPTAPASPQASRQDSPQHGVPNHDWSARAYGTEASSQYYLARSSEEAPVTLPMRDMRQQRDCFTSSTLLCGTVPDGTAASGGGGGSAGGAPAAPAAAPTRGFMAYRVSSFEALSVNSNSGSSSSSSVAVGGDVSGGLGADAGSDSTIACGGGDCATPNSSKRGEPTDALRVTGQGPDAGPGGTWPPLPQAIATSTALPCLPPTFPACGGYWTAQLGLSAAASTLGPTSAPAAESGTGDAATATLAATGCSATQAAAPGAGDDDLAAIYAELCSEEVVLTDQVVPARNAAPGTFASTYALAASSMAHPTTGFPPSVQQLQVAGNDAACHTSSSPPSSVAAAAFMKPGPPPPPPPPCDDSCAAIHPVLRGELLERQRQALMILMQSPGTIFAQTQEQALLPTCLPQQQQQQHPPQLSAACTKRPRPDDPTAVLVAPTAVTIKPHGTVAVYGFGAATECQSSSAVTLPATSQELDEPLRGLLPTGFWDGMLAAGWDGLSTTACGTAKRVHLAC
ncbi:hypothetical protein Vafri_21871 [Volvox africanus]|uniref:Uncharacterized protein n=1 Tax=Volvox africanus TaxID=51714 RepID=A0A8J4BTC1_9CHLO|nr:hypothetical protein Vafri_21871 [Volvox africanus]